MTPCQLMLISLILLTSTNSDAQPQKKRAFELIIAHTSYRPGTIKLTKIIMDHTVDQYGPYKIVSGPEMNRARGEEEMASGNIHLMWGTFSKKRVDKLRPVYSYVVMAPPRVCIIAKGNQKKFDGITTLAEWNRRGLTTGVGTYWSDVPIYKENNMLLESTPKSKLLYPMVANDRFDCFNRGAGEIFGNIKKSKRNDLEIEDSLAFIFEGKYAGFLLAPDNTYLYKRIEYGIARAWEENAFDDAIEDEVNGQRESFKSLHLENRHFISLKNPDAITSSKIRAINQDFIDGFMENK